MYVDIGEVVKGFNEIINRPGNAELGLALAGGIIGYAIRGLHALYNQRKTSSLEEQLTKNPGEEYPVRSISQAMSTGEGSKIRVNIQEFHTTPDGYSGIIVDDHGTKSPFYISQENIYEEEGGLIPILLNHSSNSKRPVEMGVAFNDEIKILIAEWIRYTMNRVDYKVQF